MRKPPPPPSYLDRAIRFVSPGWALKRQADRLRLEALTAYRAASAGRLRAGWSMGQTSPITESWSLQRLREFSRDLNRNDPVASGATDTLTVNIVGRGLRPQSRLRAEFLGLSPEKGRELQRQAENIWQAWTPRADAGNRLSFDELQFLALRKIVEDGEVLALPVVVDDSWRSISRAVELLEADRLTGQGCTTEIGRETGIDLGPRGEPRFYNLLKADPTKRWPGTPATERVPAWDKQGRPRVLHIFRSLRPGQMRGVPLFAPVISYFQDLADYLEAEVVAAKVAACLSIFITRTDPYLGAQAAATSTDAVSNKPIQDLEPWSVNYLGLGESVNQLDFKRGGETFQGFLEGVLRIIGAALSLPYELLLKDFSKTNYSSARAALLEGRRMFTAWRSWFAPKFCQVFWELVLEEAFLRGLFDAPGFYDQQAEYVRCDWIGGAWGWVDPVKEVAASKLATDYGFSTLAEECAAQGRDWEEVLEQKRREQDKIQELELIMPLAPQVTLVDQGGGK